MKYIFYTLITLAIYQPLYLMNPEQHTQNDAINDTIDEARRQFHIGIMVNLAPRMVGEIAHEHFFTTFHRYSTRDNQQTASQFDSK